MWPTAYRGRMATEEKERLRLGGMALRNGLLIHGPTHWAAAVRDAGRQHRSRLGAQARAGAGAGRADSRPARPAEARRRAGGAAAGAAADAGGAASLREPARARHDRRHAGGDRGPAQALRQLRPARGRGPGGRRRAGAGRPARSRPRRLPRGRAQGDRRLRAGDRRSGRGAQGARSLRLQPDHADDAALGRRHRDARAPGREARARPPAQ